jgi:hypothetical protein
MSEAPTPERLQELLFEAGKYFSPSAPVDERSLFAGRIGQVIQVLDAVNQKGQHVIIFGDRGVGKTSMVNVLKSFLPMEEKAVSVRINCDKGDTFDSVWRKVFAEIQPDESPTSGFLQESKPARLDITEDFVTPEIIKRQLTRWAVNSTPLIIIDEFDRIDPSYRAIFADTVKTLSDHAVGATVILVGVADSVDQLIAEHESIQRALVQVKMPRMSPAEIKEIITKGLDGLGMTIDPKALDRIALLAQGLPHYAHLLGLYSARATLQSASLHITPALLDQAVTKAIQGAQQSIRSAAHNATLSPRKFNLFADVLLACALADTDEMGSFAAQDLREPMLLITGKNYDIPSFAQHLSEFSEVKRGNILRKIGATRRFRYIFSEPLMQPFIIMSGFSEGKITNEVLDALEAKTLRHA